jgi:hypothetical protein
MILIDSVYINNSGGKTLLEYFIQKILDTENYIFLFDIRLPLESSSSVKNKIYTNPSERSRIRAYKEVFNLYQIDSIFCFSNVPPPYKIYNCNVIIFFHNALLLKNRLKCYTYFKKIRFNLKREYIKLLNYSSYKWIVQTNTMKNSLLSSIKIFEKNIYVLPFFDSNPTTLYNNANRFNKFIYVADAVPQKNHNFLLQTWKILAEKYKIYPELLVTINVSNDNPLISEITYLANRGIKIKNIGVLTSDLLSEKYLECEFLIFPSLIESFGLPLIEGCEKKCKIIAADLDYVYDIIKPSIVFDPFNSEKLANIIYNITQKKMELLDSKLVVDNKIFNLINLLNNKDV